MVEAVSGFLVPFRAVEARDSDEDVVQRVVEGMHDSVEQLVNIDAESLGDDFAVEDQQTSDARLDGVEEESFSPL